MKNTNDTNGVSLSAAAKKTGNHWNKGGFVGRDIHSRPRLEFFGGFRVIHGSLTSDLFRRRVAIGGQQEKMGLQTSGLSHSP
jgi:hypothetical protein